MISLGIGLFTTIYIFTSELASILLTIRWPKLFDSSISAVAHRDNSLPPIPNHPTLVSMSLVPSDKLISKRRDYQLIHTSTSIHYEQQTNKEKCNMKTIPFNAVSPPVYVEKQKIPSKASSKACKRYAPANSNPMVFPFQPIMIPYAR